MDLRRSVGVCRIGNCRCDCAMGFEGDDCSVNQEHHCTSHRCSGHGMCTFSVDSIVCICLEGYVGDHCEIEVLSSNGGSSLPVTGISSTTESAADQSATDEQSSGASSVWWIVVIVLLFIVTGAVIVVALIQRSRRMHLNGMATDNSL